MPHLTYSTYSSAYILFERRPYCIRISYSSVDLIMPQGTGTSDCSKDVGNTVHTSQPVHLNSSVLRYKKSLL